MTSDRITEIRVEGLRTVFNVRLRLSPMTVLTGENGSGKSTIVEACEILRLAADSKFLEEFLSIHGGFDALRSVGCNRICLGARVEGRGPALEYSFEIEDVAGLAVTHESLRMVSQGVDLEILNRSNNAGWVVEGDAQTRVKFRPVPGSKLLLTNLGLHSCHPEIARMRRALEQIDVQLPFPVLPLWVSRRLGAHIPSMRTSRSAQATDSLARLGSNLAYVYESFRRDASTWKQTMDYVRLGLGDDIEDIHVEPATGDRGLELQMEYKSFRERVPARSLSDGTLDYLAFVALFRLLPRKTLIVFDEPEQQLHPMMVARVAHFLEVMSRERTILVTTHSDRFLDALQQPAQSVVLCSLDSERRTRLVRPDAEALSQWLKEYRGLGDIRSQGFESSIMTVDDSAEHGQ